LNLGTARRAFARPLANLKSHTEAESRNENPAKANSVEANSTDWNNSADSKNAEPWTRWRVFKNPGEAPFIP